MYSMKPTKISQVRKYLYMFKSYLFPTIKKAHFNCKNADINGTLPAVGIVSLYGSTSAYSEVWSWDAITQADNISPVSLSQVYGLSWIATDLPIIELSPYKKTPERLNVVLQNIDRAPVVPVVPVVSVVPVVPVVPVVIISVVPVVPEEALGCVPRGVLGFPVAPAVLVVMVLQDIVP